MSPNSRLQPPRKHQKMEMFPGSSMVEHSAVNRRVASSNLARGANLRFFSHLNATRTFGSLPKGRWFKSGPRNHFVIHKAGIQDSGLFFVQSLTEYSLSRNFLQAVLIHTIR